MDTTTMHLLSAALEFSGLGIVLLVIAFTVIHFVTPYHLWKEIIEKQNLALAVLLGSFSIGLAMIIAAAVHG